MRRFAHVGKSPLKFTIEMYVCDIRGLPADADAIAISWERGGKVHATSKMTATSKAEGNERMAMVDDKLRMEATLYRSSKRAAFDSKQSLIRILDVSTASPAVLATAEFELADQVDLEPRSAPRSKQLRMPRVVRRGDRAAEITVQLSLSSVRHAAGAGADADGADAIGSILGGAYPALETAPSVASASTSSMASTALTHEALAALEASHASKDARGHATAALPPAALAKHQMKRSTSFGRSRAAGNKELDHLTQLVEAARADARQTESRLAALQHRLRTEVVEEGRSALLKAQALKKPEEQAKACTRQLQLMIDQSERIALDKGGSLAGGAGVSSLESEVLILRRELAAAKMEIARLAGENDELGHVTRRLNRELVSHARAGATATPSRKR